MDFLEKLDFLMKRYELNKRSLSRKSEIPYTTIDNWYKRGYENLTLPTLRKLASYFNTTLDYWFLDEITDPNYGKSSGFKVEYTEMEHIKKYRNLDDYGRENVDAALTRESKRIEQYGKLDKRNVVILAEYEASKAPTHIIPYWEYGVSAGNGIYQLNDTTSVMMTLWATEITKQADFIIKVSGGSMEPDYHDGDKVLVDRKTVVQKGEVGIFVKNGDTYIKELGENELISRNAEFPNIPVKDFDNVVCLGKVIGILTDSLIAEE